MSFGFRLLNGWDLVHSLGLQTSLDGFSTRRFFLMGQGLWGLIVLMNPDLPSPLLPPSLLMGWPEGNSHVKSSI